MKKYGLHSKLVAAKGNGDALEEILLKAAGLMATARGCRLYLVSRDPKHKDTIWVTEAWDSKEDHDNSLKLEAVKGLISKAVPLLNGPPEGGQELEVLGGFGLEGESPRGY